jgi:uncharacterized membrane protein YfcA
VTTLPDDNEVEVPKKRAYGNLIFAMALVAIGVVLFFSLDTHAAAPSFTFDTFVELWVILFFSGLTCGISGFAFSSIGNLSQLLIPPITAVPMLQGLSIFNQLTSITKLRKDMPKKFRDWFPYGPGPAILGGFLGVQAGVWVLNNLPGPVLTLSIGILVCIYSLYLTFKPAGFAVRGYDGPAPGAAVGAVGGAIGGFTAFPGLPVVMWTGLRDISKAQTRAIVQPFIVFLQLAAIATNAYQHPERFGKHYWTMLALTVPAVLPGTLTGVWIYHKLSEGNFKRLVFILLMLVGTTLVLKGWSGMHL